MEQNTAYEKELKECIKTLTKIIAELEQEKITVNAPDSLQKAAEEYANSQVPNPGYNDDPHCTTIDIWQDIKDAVIYGSTLSTHPQPVQQGCVWVKASQRLPVETRARLSWRFTNKASGGFGFNKKNGFRYCVIEKFTKDYRNIEWLDESTTAASTPKEIAENHTKCTCENQKLGQTICDRNCVDFGEFD